jgi:tRNA dimethylallyltransferase
LVVIAGPTGSGKSDLAIAVAREFGGEVVGCDSVQVYRYFNIGSAKVLGEERHGVRHHLLDVAGPGDVFTAGDYSRLARQTLRAISDRGNAPVVVGGTGFYLRALVEGLFEGPGRDEALRARLLERESRRAGSLHRILGRLDAASAGRIHQRDVQKTVRALEVVLSERRPLGEVFAAGREKLEGFRVLKFGLNPERPALYRRIEERSRRMFERGLVEEVRGILAMGYSRTAKPVEALGYAQALRVIDGEWTVEQAVAETALHTRRYAKRQWTWFRREAGMVWVEGFGEETKVQEIVFSEIRKKI